MPYVQKLLCCYPDQMMFELCCTINCTQSRMGAVDIRLLVIVFAERASPDPDQAAWIRQGQLRGWLCRILIIYEGLFWAQPAAECFYFLLVVEYRDCMI